MRTAMWPFISCVLIQVIVIITTSSAHRAHARMADAQPVEDAVVAAVVDDTDDVTDEQIEAMFAQAEREGLVIKVQ